MVLQYCLLTRENNVTRKKKIPLIAKQISFLAHRRENHTESYRKLCCLIFTTQLIAEERGHPELYFQVLKESSLFTWIFPLYYPICGLLWIVTVNNFDGQNFPTLIDTMTLIKKKNNHQLSQSKFTHILHQTEYLVSMYTNLFYFLNIYVQDVA